MGSGDYHLINIRDMLIRDANKRTITYTIGMNTKIGTYRGNDAARLFARALNAIKRKYEISVSIRQLL